MYYLIKKMRRDLWSYKGQFLSVFVMTFLCIFIFSGIEELWNSMETNSNSYFEKTKLADVWVSVNSLSDKNIENIEDIEEIKSLDIQAITYGKVLDNKKSADFQIISPEKNNVSILHIIDGKKYDKSGSGVWIDSFYADSKGLKIDDTVEIEVNDKVKKEKISGIVMSPEYIGYTGPSSVTPTDHGAYGYMVVGSDLFESLIDSNINYNQIKINLKNQKTSNSIRQKISDILGSNLISYTDRETNSNITYFTNKIASVKQVSILFSLIFLLLALLTIYSTINRLVQSQRVQIGTLAAIGFSKNQILIHYLSYGSLISLLGSLLGYACSFFLGKMLIASQQKFHKMPDWRIPISAISITLIVLVIVICSLGALFASCKLVKSNPALIMKNQNSLSSKKEKNINIGFLSYEWNWILRDMIRSKLRVLIGIIGVLGSLVLLLSAFGLRDSVQYSNKYVYGEIFSYNTKVNVKASVDINSIEQLDGANGQWIQENSAELEVDDSIEMTNLLILDDGNFVKLFDKNASEFSSEQTIITRKLADRLNIKENSKIRMKLSSDSSYKNYTITEIIDIPYPQGLYISKDNWEEHDNNFVPTSYLCDKHILKEDNKDIISVVTLKEQLQSTNEIMQSIYTVIIAMIFASILLSVVILYNLGMLNFVERSKEYSTLKVLGFKNSELFKLVFYDSLPSLITGCVLGLIVGVSFMGVFVLLVSTNVRGYLPHLTATNIVLSLVVVIGCTLIVDYIIYRKIKKLNLVESLKSSE